MRPLEYFPLWPSLLMLATLFSNSVDKKLISRSKKEMENFIQAKFEDYNPRRASQISPRTVPPVGSKGTVSFLRQRAVHQKTYY